jgi:hypothetical protein
MGSGEDWGGRNWLKLGSGAFGEKGRETITEYRNGAKLGVGADEAFCVQAKVGSAQIRALRNLRLGSILRSGNRFFNRFVTTC